MGRVLYFDTFSGVSGDMTVAALLALGVPFEVLRQELAKLGVAGYRLERSQCQVNGIAATRFEVILEDPDRAGGHGHRPFSDIRRQIEASDLSPAVRQRAIAIFTKLALAEGRVHDKPAEDVAFHEVGAIDSIVDIVGAAIAVEELGVDRAYVAPLPLGSGFIDCQHGRMPVPAPATVELLEGFAVRYDDGDGELVTPTGAAIIAALAECAGSEPLPNLRIEGVGYGAGTRVLEDRPNLLRLVLGEVDAGAGDASLLVLEANIDDSNPEIFEHVTEVLLAAGARDVWLQPVVMKKGRPAVVLSILADAGLRDVIAGIVLRETSSIGVRYYAVDRMEAPRVEMIVSTEFGKIPVKVARAPDGTANLAPEYEVCRRIAREKNVALKTVYAAAIAAALTS